MAIAAWHLCCAASSSNVNWLCDQFQAGRTPLFRDMIFIVDAAHNVSSILLKLLHNTSKK